jgi:hypothetical protein
MFLRVSSEAQNKKISLDVITQGNASSIDSLIPDSEYLVNFAEAIVGRKPEEIEKSRNVLTKQLCDQAMIEAAGVASNFQRMVRIADATGIPLGGFEEVSQDIRSELALDDFLLQKQN